MSAKNYLLVYNLQYFAKDGPGGEKTEEPTAKKLDDTRKEGNVAKSRDMVNAISLISGFFLLKLLIGDIGNGLKKVYITMYTRISTASNPRADEINQNTILALLKDILIDSFMVILPIMLISFAVVFIAEVVQVKWRVTFKPMQPKLSKLNPIKGFKKVFSMQAVMTLLKSLALIIIIIFVSWQTIASKSAYLFNFYEVPLTQALGIIGDIVINLGIKISVIYLLVGLSDFVYQKFKFKNDVKMTKQEVKDEYKNSEGDPQVKSQIKQRMRQASMRRMMQDLPKADVVITNPTHFAVALKYDLDVAKAPIVLAKGQDFLAQKIKEAARENNIEIVENRPLARALYANVDIGQEIPEELYQAVAEVLAYVYGIKNGTNARK